jgi:hypothetical protein
VHLNVGNSVEILNDWCNVKFVNCSYKNNRSKVNAYPCVCVLTKPSQNVYVSSEVYNDDAVVCSAAHPGFEGEGTIGMTIHKYSP